MKVEILKSEKQKESLKKTQLTHIKGKRGWMEIGSGICNESIDRIIYLGKCNTYGDTFAIYYNGNISLCKGHMNDGVY